MMEYVNIFDYTILKFWHEIAVVTHGALTPYMRYISYFFDLEKGVPLLLISLFLVLFRKTRKTGMVMVGAVLFGLLLTNLGLKTYVARLRPFQAHHAEYLAWWKYVGSTQVKEFSFPSGHATATMAAMMGLFLTTNKKWSWIGFIFVLAMCISRNYLMVHYPSDVLAGVGIGFIAGFLSLGCFFLFKRFCETHLDIKFCRNLCYSGLFND